MMRRLTALLGIAALPACLSGSADSMETAASLLLDNHALCMDVAGESGTDAADAGRRALARESVKIAEEIVGRVARRGPEWAPLERALDLQRRLCGESVAGGVREALASDAAVVKRELALLAADDRETRERVVARFLGRQEEAAMSAVEAARRRDSREASGGWGERRSDGGGEVVTMQLEESRDEPVGPRSGPHAEPKVVEVTERWDPSPDELGRRRMLASRALRERLYAWVPSYERQVRTLIRTRVSLARDLRHQSLEQLRLPCGSFAEAVAAFDYSVVLQAPEEVLREDLHRMLAGYAAAGRLCGAGRFALAWSEINGADRRWSRVVARLSMLERGAGGN